MKLCSSSTYSNALSLLVKRSDESCFHLSLALLQPPTVVWHQTEHMQVSEKNPQDTNSEQMEMDVTLHAPSPSPVTG